MRPKLVDVVPICAVQIGGGCRVLVFDASALLAIFADIDRPDLIKMLNQIYSILVVTSHVDAEIIDLRSRGTLDGLVESGSMSTLRINTDEEILRFQDVHKGMGAGETDVILACKKIVSDGGSARGVLDERTGRAVARELGIEFTGLIGLLEELRGRGILDGGEYSSIARGLRVSKFRIPRGF